MECMLQVSALLAEVIRLRNVDGRSVLGINCVTGMKYTEMNVRKIGYNERPYMEQILGSFCNAARARL